MSAYLHNPDTWCAGTSTQARRLVNLRASVERAMAAPERGPMADERLFNDSFELRSTAAYLIADATRAAELAVRSPGCFCQAGVVAPPDSPGFGKTAQKLGAS